ncbi:IS3 family transposase [Vulgatibacter incomptus]|nr:IS3 family transposase [Vulgatibacter incomptus]
MGRTPYSEAFKAKMVEKLTGPHAMSATALARQSGIAQATLSRWLLDAGRLGVKMDDRDDKSTRQWTSEEKLQVLIETASLSDDELGSYLRQKGLHKAQLDGWRATAVASLGSAAARRSVGPDAKRVRELERELRRKEKALAETAALLVLKKKVQGDLGGRGRRHGREERKVILELLDEAVVSGARFERACEEIGLSARSVQRWRAGAEDDLRCGPLTAPRNKLSEAEQQRILALVTSPRFRDLSPAQIVPLLADEGTYVASEATIYRLLRREKLLKHRQASRPPMRRKRPEHVATGPNQVWVWDITYLRGPIRGMFFRLYTILDLWSRKVVGWAVHDVESEELAKELFVETCRRWDVNPSGMVFHADNGAAMKGSTLQATLQVLGVVPSFSRPRVSNDNAFAEAHFRTMKYRPDFPSRPFTSLAVARAWVESFVAWYNATHLHSGIRFVTPAQRHAGQDLAILEKRAGVYAAARERWPERWSGSTRNWSRIQHVRLTPERTAAA